MPHAALTTLYEETSARTLALWRNAPGIGETMQSDYYDKTRFAPTTGIQPLLSAALRVLLEEVNTLAEGDPLADAMPLNGLHFTFLAVTLPLYQRQQRPEKLAELLEIWEAYRARPTCISELQLVALPGQLLLAGIPDSDSAAARKALAQRLLRSGWRDEITARYHNTPLPPPFWHSTLLRYRAQRLPEPWREFFLTRRQQRYGAVSAPRQLVMTNYNWTQVDTLD